jgi:hypothetical protein
MKRAMPVYLLAALATLTYMPAARAVGVSAPSRPPGVTASSWIPITQRFGAVIEQPMADRFSGGQPLPSALGYFVVRRDGHWLRLDSLLLQSMALRSPPAASKWISIDRRLRFVIERQTSGQLMRAQSAAPSALGYFIIRRGGQWLRLSPDPQGALYRGPLRPPAAASTSLPISESLRFVIEQQTPARYVPPGKVPSVLGYFVSKHEGHWVRLGSIA